MEWWVAEQSKILFWLVSAMRILPSTKMTEIKMAYKFVCPKCSSDSLRSLFMDVYPETLQNQG